MKILFCTNKFSEVSNGPAKFANLILKINESNPDFEIRILTEDIDSSKKYIYKLNLSYPKLIKKFSQFIRIFTYHYAAVKIKKEFEFDVIVYNNAFIGLLSAIRFSKTIGMINDDNNMSVKTIDLLKNYDGFKKNIFKVLEKLSTKYFSKIIFNSEYLKKRASSIYNLKKHKTSILYKGVELSRIKKNTHEIDISCIKILFVKTDFERGGLIDLIEALSYLDYQFELKIIGVDYLFFSSKYNLNNFKNIDFKFLGQQSQNEVKSAMLNSDIFCVPSKMEALGVANIEAMEVGLPVVSTNVGGIPEVLDYGNCGFLAQPNNPSDLSQKIKQCIEDKSLRLEKVENAIGFVKKFDINNAIKNFISILK
jgi:colanic acid/amylovoran biosynthesis glycosyltransferase